ncbi:hypothetical protein [Amycolatopsis benzoatilytica]|nr:hypothetical protein [Amycolatopsis benzoatilytica]
MTIPATLRALRQTSQDGPSDMRLVTDAGAWTHVLGPPGGWRVIATSATG